tara:strand:- start:149 stop:337 length:189 start_codon:yes stop_codon:yes gene_type:complete
MATSFKFEIIDIKKAAGNIADFAIMETGDTTGETALTLLGWDEIGALDSLFINPVYIRVIND